jgi:hypothetical protein
MRLRMRVRSISGPACKLRLRSPWKTSVQCEAEWKTALSGSDCGGIGVSVCLCGGIQLAQRGACLHMVMAARKRLPGTVGATTS